MICPDTHSPSWTIGFRPTASISYLNPARAGMRASASCESGATQGKETSLLGCESMCASTKTEASLGSTLDEHCFSEATIESAVSAYIECNFSVSILGASDSDAACRLEELCIGTVSHCSHCAPSKAWLGRHADPRIAQSGLWQIMHLYGKGLEEADLQGHRH
jgi:hypothetical protein